jgi:two-component sensor histidine kinase
MIERLEARCRELAIEPPTPDRVERIARTALRAHEDRFHADLHQRLSPATRERLDALLRSDGAGDTAQGDSESGAPAVLLSLRGSPGRPSLASMQDELAKLERIRQIALPANLFDRVSARDLERCRRRVSVEAPHELRRHPEAARITWLAAYVYLRARTLTDDLVDLLIETIHQIGARAERKVERELLDDLKRVTGKQNLLFELADATLAQPDGVVRDVVFPVVSEQTLRDLVKEWKATGPTYRVTLRTVIRNSYQGHYRRMVPKLLAHLNRAQALADASVEEAHHTVWALRGAAAADTDVASAVSRMVEALTLHAPITVSVQVEGGATVLGSERLLQLLRLLREAVVNVLRHAQASQLSVQINTHQSTLTIAIRDNGRGFDPQTGDATRDFGLVGMRERAQRIGAQFTLNSALGHGTVVEVQLAIEAKHNP